MRVLDLFSGIGGFSLGLERAGMRTVAFCETDEFCQRVLKKHWPEVPCFGDIRGIDARGLAGLDWAELICGGFPCQPFSIAGRQEGQADDRHLWPEMLRVIALARPAWVIAENVPGAVPVVLDQMLADLEGLGYAARALTIPACAVDAPHNRDRLWVVANANGKGLEGLYDPRHRERLQLPKAAWKVWEAEPGVDRVALGVPNRVDRLRSLGNSVVPQVVEVIGRAIMTARNTGVKRD